MSQQQSGERTEKATPKRRREARQRGQVRKSAEVNIAFILLVDFGVLAIFGNYIADNLTAFLKAFFGGTVPAMLDPTTVGNLFLDAMLHFAMVVAPILAASVISAVLINVVQVGFLFSTKAAAPKFDKINPIKGFKRIFSVRSLIELLKNILKIVIVAWLAYGEYQAQLGSMPNMMALNVADASRAMVSLLTGLAFKLGFALLIFAAFDYMYQWWRYEKDLRMTKQEIRDEYKITEGDPQTKGRIRQKQRQISSLRMMHSVPQADVVVTNPTQYAIALQYDDKQHKAPVVLAKGKDNLARRIREIATEHHIEMVENKPLAQALYFYCEVGDEVPEDLYKAVAEILAYVYRLKNKQGGGR